mgnify:CR=1 FL=1
MYGTDKLSLHKKQILCIPSYGIIVSRFQVRELGTCTDTVKSNSFESIIIHSCRHVVIPDTEREFRSKFKFSSHT